jgi:RNA polymerase sporulation-specific sigma factor
MEAALSRDEAICNNLNLVRHVAKRFIKRGEQCGLEFDDLVSVGTLGLIKAYDKFEPERGNKFSTYAVPMIRGTIYVYLRDNGSLVHFSRSYKEAFSQIVMNNLIDAPGKEIAATLNISTKVMDGARRYGEMMASLDYEVESVNGNEPTTIHDLIGAKQDHSLIAVNEFISQLSDDEAEVARGLMDGQTQLEIGVTRGTSQVQISRVKTRIAEKLSKYLNGEAISVRGGSGVGDVQEAKRLLQDTSMSYREISEKTGVPFGTVNSHGSRIRAQVKQDKHPQNVLAQHGSKLRIEFSVSSASADEVLKEFQKVISIISASKSEHYEVSMTLAM